MKNVPENELFSAYLDGELTADEQAQVERLLASSPAARQLMDELRALGATLQAMPTYKLEEDLTPQVLRAAERRMLGQNQAEAEPSQQATPSAADGEAVPSPWKGIGRRLLTPRSLLYPALAVAVAVLLMVFDPGRDRPADGPGEVAQAPADRQPRAEPSRAAIRAADEADREAAPTAPVEKTAGEVEKAVGEKEAAGEKDLAKKPNELKELGVGHDATAADTPSAGAAGKGAATPPPEKAVAKKPASAAPVARESKPKAPPPEALAGKEGGMGAGYRYQEGQGARPDPRSRGHKSGDLQDKALGAYGAIGRKPGAGQTVQPGPGDADPLADAAVRRALQRAVAPGTAIVVCDVSLQAARSGAFGRLLSRQQILLEEDSCEGRDLAEKLVEKLAEKGVANGRKGPGTDWPSRRAGGKSKKRAAPEAVEMVVVEATPAQIEATLAALNAEPDKYITLDIKPALNRAGQQDWLRYNRDPLTEDAKPQFTGTLNAPATQVKSDHTGRGDRYKSEQETQKKRLQEQHQVDGLQSGWAQRFKFELPGRNAQPSEAPADEFRGRPADQPATSPIEPTKPSVTQPAPRPAEVPARPSAEPDDGRGRKDALKTAPDQKPAAEQSPVEPAPEAPGAAPADAVQTPAEMPSAPVAKTQEKVQEGAEVPEVPKGPDAKQAPSGLPRPLQPQPKAERKPKRHERDKRAEEEESKDADKGAVETCQVLFVLRVVDPDDVAAIAAALRARAARIEAMERAQPPAAAAEFDASRGAPAKQAAPAAKH